MSGGWDGAGVTRRADGRKWGLANGDRAARGEHCNKTTAAVVAIVAFIGAMSLALLLAGCSTTPTGIERALFTTQTNYVVKEVLLTNVVPVAQYVPQIVSVTNVTVDHQVQVTQVTNVVTTYVNQTNITPVTVTNPVVTLTGASGLLKTGETVAGTAANIAMPGTSGIVTAAIGGLAALYMGWRNRKLQGHNDVLSQSAGAMGQIIETAREVLKKTPQGQAAADKLTNWMISHQAASGTITAISQIVKDSVDNGDAKDAADQIMGLIGDSSKSKS